ncbi:MAG: 30S ribosomal protein S2, partial [Thermoleophilia bacterium]|nr:30S ribosomal protein S2 [Thermoleophilia bacterium]
MPAVTESRASIKDLLIAGVHFGHQTRRWNPKMKPYIFGERGGIYIIDLQKTTVLLDEACAFLKDTAARGGLVLFVGTKKQCQETIKEQSERIGMPYVMNRWLGGLLTNFSTLNKRIRRLHELRQLATDGSLDLLPTREAMNLRADLRKLEQNLGGVADMDRLPAAVFVVDPRKEQIVVREARKLKIPIVGLVDTNCDPDEIDYLIPGNDDAIRSCNLVVRVVADAVAEGRAIVTEREMKAAREAEAKAEADRKAREAAAKAEAERQAAEAAASKAAAEAARAAAEAAPAASAAKAAAAPEAPKAEAKAEAAKPAAKKPEAAPEASPAEAKPAAKPAAEKKPAAEAKPEAKAEPKPEAKADEKTDAKADAKVEAKTDAKPEAAAKPAKKTEPKAAKKADEPKAEADKADEPKAEDEKADEAKAEAETADE